MITYPNAKINIGLRVVRRRKDGFHDLESAFVPVPWRDILEIIPGEAFQFSTSGIAIPGISIPGISILGEKESNLCVKAYTLLAQDVDLPPVHMHLHKIIPIGAGLGGGSADGAFVLKALNELFSLILDEETLAAYAAQLGSDCPFFIANQPAMAYGTGNRLEPLALELSGKTVVLVKPSVFVATADAYRSIVPRPPSDSLKEMLETMPMADWKDRVMNDFERTVFAQYPELVDIKVALYQQGATYASMSGSGSTLYGLFEQPPASLAGVFPQCEVYQAVL